MAGTRVKRGVRKPAAKTEAAPAKAAPAKARGVKSELTASEEKATQIAAQTKEIVKLRNAGDKWSDIAEAVGTTPGRAIFLYGAATVDDDDRITARNDGELGKKLLKMRKEGIAWGPLAYRTGMSEAKLKRLFVEAGGDLSEHVGRGGRTAGPVDKAAAKTRKPATAKAKSKPVVRTRAKKAA